MRIYVCFLEIGTLQSHPEFDGEINGRGTRIVETLHIDTASSYENLQVYGALSLPQESQLTI